MEYPRCHLYFLRMHTVFKLIVHLKEIHVQVTYVLFHVITIIILLYLLVSAHGVTGQFCRRCSTVRPAKLESSLSCAPD